MNEPSNQTLKVMIESLEKKGDARHEDYKDRHGKIETKLDNILDQTTKTNGRVTKLEDTTTSITKIIETHNSELFGKEGVVDLKKKAAWAITLTKFVWPGIFILASWALTYYMKDFKRDILESQEAHRAQTVTLTEKQIKDVVDKVFDERIRSIKVAN